MWASPAAVGLGPKAQGTATLLEGQRNRGGLSGQFLGAGLAVFGGSAPARHPDPDLFDDQ